MRFLNKVILIGRVGNLNLKSKTNAAGVTTRILDISLVTPKVIKNKATGEFTEKPIWHSISVFGDATIDYALKFEKGDTIYIYGYIDVIDLVDATGMKKKITKIVVDVTGELKLFEKKRVHDSPKEDDGAKPVSTDGSTDYSSDDSLGF